MSPAATAWHHTVSRGRALRRRAPIRCVWALFLLLSATTLAQVPFNDAVQVSAGHQHTCVLDGSGGVKCWGRNDRGQLGDGSTLDQMTAVEVSGLSSGVVGIAVGAQHSCALTDQGTVKCWGSNAVGALGIGSFPEFSPIPVEVPVLSERNIQVIAGADHSCALDDGGAVKCWGYNLVGQAGDGSGETFRWTPVDVLGLSSGVTALAAGSYHSCAQMGATEARCWGHNLSAQLGGGFGGTDQPPILVQGLTLPVSQFSGGGWHTCVLTDAGGVQCWGNNGSGQLGDGNTTSRTQPAPVSGLDAGVVTLSSGMEHSCATTDAGALMCWGDNGDGQLGDGSTAMQSSPVPVPALQSGVTAVSAGESHTCAITDTGRVLCWGDNSAGQLGDGTVDSRPLPADALRAAAEPGAPVINEVVAGEASATISFEPPMSDGGVAISHYTVASDPGGAASTECPDTPCVVTGLENGTTYSFTVTATNAIGSGPASAPVYATPNWAPVPFNDAVKVVTNSTHSCALLRSGGVKCWGQNEFGQLGDGGTSYSRVAVQVAGLESGVADISVGHLFSCGLTTSGGVKCWGINYHTGFDLLPADVEGLTSGVLAISSGNDHSCAVTSAGGVKCWGFNRARQLGDGTDVDFRPAPVDVLGLESGVTELHPGAFQTCARLASGMFKCWGLKIGRGPGPQHPDNFQLPIEVPGLATDAQLIRAGGFHACALTDPGGVECWGSFEEFPVAVNGLQSGVVAIAAGFHHSCAVTSAGGGLCWGRNAEGQLGDGGTTLQREPVAVSWAGGGLTGIAAGQTHSCAVADSGRVLCWGANAYGVLGDGSTTTRLTPVDALRIPAAPSAPIITEVVPGDASAAVSFDAPLSDGGVGVSEYVLIRQPDGSSSTSCAESPCIVAGLENGTAYSFTVVASNAIGDSPASAPSPPATPRAAQSISFGDNPGPLVYGGATATVSAQASSGLTVDFSTTTPLVCSVTAEGEVSPLTAGDCIVTADQPGDAATQPAVQALQTVAIDRAAQAALGMSVSSPALVYLQTALIEVEGGAGEGAIALDVSEGSDVCALDASTVAAIGVGSCTITATKAGDLNHLPASASIDITVDRAEQQPLIVVAGSAVIAFAESTTLTATGGSGSGAISFAVTAGDAFCSVAGDAVTGTAVGSCTVTATRAADDNYNAASDAVEISVEAAEQFALQLTAEDTDIGVGALTRLVASGGSGTGVVQMQVTDGAAACVLKDDSLTGLAPGACTVTATKAGDHQYESSSATARVTVNAVNQAPSLELAGNIFHQVDESGARTVEGFASSHPGAGEQQQSVTFHVEEVAAQPGVVEGVLINVDGNLHYTLLGPPGGARFRVRAQDDGGTAYGGSDTSATREFRILIGNGANVAVLIERIQPAGPLQPAPTGGTGLVAYRLGVANHGPADAPGLQVRMPAPGALLDVLWNCDATPAACVPAEGAQSADLRFDLAAGARATIELSAALDLSMDFIELAAEASTPTPLISTGEERALMIEPIGDRALFMGGFEPGPGVPEPGQPSH